MSLETVYVGTAAWSIPKVAADHFKQDGSHLERYASRLNAVEINSSFYRDHKPDTYARWAESVDDGFRFSVKLSKLFTHELKLEVTKQRLKDVLQGPAQLGRKWGALLVQLPPSLKFDRKRDSVFFAGLRDEYDGTVVFEPRHRSWLANEALSILKTHSIAKVIADPEPCPLDVNTFDDLSMAIYFRLHGSPEIYKSKYEQAHIQKYAQQISRYQERGKTVWCLFDNTTFGHATLDALSLKKALSTQNINRNKEFEFSAVTRVS